MAHIRQGIRRIAKLKNKKAKYTIKYTYAQGIKTKNNSAKKYTYKKTTIKPKKYSYSKKKKKG